LHGLYPDSDAPLLPRAATLALALQLPFYFDVRALSGRLVSSAPE
jgi:hypothetical protein